MKRYIRSNYEFDSINSFVDRALDIKSNQFSNWRSLQDIRNDENIQNLGEIMFGYDYENSKNYQEATRRVFEELIFEEM